MLGVDDSSFKLLKMKEKQLELSIFNKEESLREYRELVEKIDNLIFEEIKKRLEMPNYRNQSLEEELSFLEEIVGFCDQLLEFQIKKRSVYEKYSGSQLVLTDINDLNINGIKERIRVINGYLINISNIDKNKKSIEEKNEQLAYEAKKKENQISSLNHFEDELISRFLNAVGKKTSDNSKNEVLVSLHEEYTSLDEDVSEIINDSDRLHTLLANEMVLEQELDEKIKTANICYNNNPSFNNKCIFDDMKVEEYNLKYRISLIKILDLISKRDLSCGGAKAKREKILDLIKCRRNCLKYTGIEYIIDPFEEFEKVVNEQLISVIKMSDNTVLISKLRREISELNTRIEDMLNQNIEYLSIINGGNCIFGEDIKEKNVGFTKIIEDQGLSVDKLISPNEVVNVRKTSNMMNFGKINDKTRNVIKKVFEIISNPNDSLKTKENKLDTIGELEEDIVPDLFIESKPQEIFKEKYDTASNKNEDDDLFEIIEPFETTPMFVDRSDDGYKSIMAQSPKESVSSNLSVSTDDSYDFWKLPEEDNKQNNEGISSTVTSLDDQVDELLNKSKSKRLVA